MSMRSDLRRSAVCLVTALTLGVTVTPALAEEPVPATVGIGRAVTDAEQRGTFRVTAWTDAPQAAVASVSAKVRHGNTVLAEIPALVENPSSRGTFALPADATLKLTEDGGSVPALGKYAIDVTATDSAGNTVVRADAGTLDFTLRPSFESFGVGTPSWSDKNLRPKGRLLGIQPGSGDRVPLTGRTVAYQRTGEQGGPIGSATTADTGGFTGEPVPATREYESINASYSEDSAEVHGTAIYHAWSSARTKRMTLTASADRTRALSGETVTLTGRLTDPENAGAPLADEPVQAGVGNGLPKTVRTDADGRFTVQFVAAPVGDGSGWWVRKADLFQEWFTAGGPLALPKDSRTTVMGYSLAPDARLMVWGEFRSPYERWSSTSSNQTVVLEQSPDGRTGWSKVASTSFYSDVRASFGISAWNKGGWFRLRHLTTDYYAESVSRTFHIVRTPTRVLNVNASPEPVRKGATVTVTGTLQQDVAGWKPLASQQVQLRFRAKGSSKWITVAKGSTAANGGVALKHTATGDGVYTLFYAADGTHFQATGTGDYVDVR